MSNIAIPCGIWESKVQLLTVIEYGLTMVVLTSQFLFSKLVSSVPLCINLRYRNNERLKKPGFVAGYSSQTWAAYASYKSGYIVIVTSSLQTIGNKLCFETNYYVAGAAWIFLTVPSFWISGMPVWYAIWLKWFVISDNFISFSLLGIHHFAKRRNLLSNQQCHIKYKQYIQASYS